MLVKVMVEVIFILAIATKEINQNSASALIPGGGLPLLTHSSLFSRSTFEEAVWKDGRRERVAETRKTDSRGGSHGYCRKSESHVQH